MTPPPGPGPGESGPGTSGGTPPRRVRVASPRRDARRRSEKRPDAVELTEQTGLGEIYLTALLRAQLRLALAILLGVGGILVGLPAAFLIVPQLAVATVGPVPLLWVVAGVGAYPLVLGAARIHIHLAERIERDFTDLMAGR